MAVNDTVRGLKGTITKLQQQLEAANAYNDELLRTNEALVARVADLEKTYRAFNTAIDGHNGAVARLEKDIDRARRSETDALIRLQASEAERNRLNGYIQRVAEDDAAREGNADVADVRSVPRRPAPPLSHGPDYGSIYNGALSGDGASVSGGHRRY